ncbi:nucleolar protein 8 [Silurus meridionalis]|uniref:nucleolar protein 8 n=1 Tax=Silurus meridionalis TaxID=175797 RepID=UPI001EEBC219|nr:nucleolar protein 8 [Silurus meridionalis]
MKRLYVGGLSHTISQKDLRDRFGKFGEVSDVEIITRKDEHGSPLKTFAYINLTISDSDYKRCVTVLNKSKWKGGTLQIELAKESFLQRLAKERQQAAEKTHTPKTDVKEKIVESFIAAGVENFHMKAAVPGTEIPGHKDWVVSKFGRVLPIVHLKCQGKTKALKYDPSKHCHNIKKLESEDCFTPVSELTWQIDGGDDEISKRRRGEFPRQKKRPKKTIQSLDPSTNPYSTTIPERWTTGQNRDASQLLQSRKPAVCVFNSDCDSEDEIRTLVAQELSQNHEMVTIEDEGNLEVVSDDFVVKSNMFWGSGETDMVGQIGLKSTRNDEDYDSADTDEILRQNKNSDKTEETEKSNKSLVKSKKIDGKKLALSNNQTPTDSESDNGSESSSESGDSDYEAMMGSCHRLELSLADLENLVKKMEDDESSDDDTNAGTSELPERSSVHEREPQRAQSKKSGINPEDILASLFEPDEDKEEKKEKVMSKKKSCLPAFVGTKDLFGSAAKITGLKRAAEKVNCEFGEEPKRLKSGLKTLEDEESSSEQVPELNKKDTNVSMDCSSEDMMINEEPIKLNSKPSSSLKVNDRTCPVLTKTTSLRQSKHSARSSSSGEEEEDEETVPLEPKTSKEHERSASDSSGCSEESDTSSDEEEEESTKREAASEPKQINSSALGPKQFQQTVLDPVKQQQDNQKRLAALEQRQKESEQQKQLIQGALSKVDLPNANKGKHIVFDSDDEVSNDRENTTQQKASLFDEESDDDASGSEEKQDLKEKELKRARGSKLFDSSEDEDDGTDEGHFKIKPQFEGRAGQKLMELQSRFGTDPRFQMDAKFLESEEQEEDVEPLQMPGEQELVEEKKKNLAILQSILNIKIQPSDGATKGKIFKDISALHYDPSSETHAAFETKTDTTQKESKAARRKKREEAAKLPECSKDIYYDVTTDLKEAFGTVKEIQTENKQVSWDQDDNDDDDNDDDDDVDDDDEDGQAPQGDMPALSSSTNQESEPSSRFKFSFFGDDDVTKAQTTDEYKVETIKGAKVAWQVDPRFQDSSSEEEEEEKEEEKEGKKEAAVVTTSKQPVPTKKFFFFFDDDIRLKEGPGMFCRLGKLEDQRDAWEEKRKELSEEYRKKHKDAKRRVKMTTKS